MPVIPTLVWQSRDVQFTCTCLLNDLESGTHERAMKQQAARNMFSGFSSIFLPSVFRSRCISPASSAIRSGHRVRSSFDSDQSIIG